MSCFKINLFCQIFLKNKNIFLQEKRKFDFPSLRKIYVQINLQKKNTDIKCLYILSDTLKYC